MMDFFKVSAESNFEKRMMADSSQTRTLRKVDGQFLGVRWWLYRPILDVYTLLHFGQTKVWNEDDWDAAHSFCLLRLSFAASCLSDSYLRLAFHAGELPQWGAADAEIKVPSGENTELKRSPFKAGSRSVYIHTCYAYCQEFLSCLFLPFQSIHLHLKKTLRIFSCLGCG